MQRGGADQKRKRNVLTLEQKIEILRQFERNRGVTALAEEYNIGKQTVRDIVKKKAELENFLAEADSSKAISDRKTLKGSTFQELDDAMSKWFFQKSAEGVPISGPMCARQAQKFHEQLKIEGNFTASSGWLYRFKKRHRIRELAVQGEKLSADVAMVEFCYDLENIIKQHNLRPEQIYNGDETGLYWKAMPRRTLAAGPETSAPGFKMNKDRITVLCCANASGTHKLKLAVVGKPKNPLSFKNVNPKYLPVDYYNQKAAWMDPIIFRKWFFEKFIPQVKSYLEENNLPPKAVLLLDDAPAHPDAEDLKSKDGNIFVAYFPPNVTSVAQPMEQGVIETMKRLYRKDLMLQLLEEDDFMEFRKSLNLKEAIYAVARAWNGVKATNIQKAFYKIMTLEDEEVEDELSIENIASIASGVNGLEEIGKEVIQEWIGCDYEEKGYQILTDDDLLEENSQISSENRSDRSSDDDERNCVVIRSHKEAREAVNVLIEYFEEQSQADGIEILQLRKMKEFIRIQLYETEKQKKINDFFS